MFEEEEVFFFRFLIKFLELDKFFVPPQHLEYDKDNFYYLFPVRPVPDFEVEKNHEFESSRNLMNSVCDQNTLIGVGGKAGI